MEKLPASSAMKKTSAARKANVEVSDADALNNDWARPASRSGETRLSMARVSVVGTPMLCRKPLAHCQKTISLLDC